MSPARIAGQAPVAPVASPRRPPSLASALSRGARNRCPVCGEGRIFAGYLRPVAACAACATPLAALRADDAPPYVVIFLAGHLLLPPILWVERAYMPPMWLHMALWLPLMTLVCLALLRPVKGAVIGLMLQLGLSGAERSPDA
jgi:uncharacterized protein (DUF983 family)